MGKEKDDLKGRLRQGDYVYYYWMAPGGYTAWLFSRGDHLFLGCIRNNVSEAEIALALHSESQVDSVATVFSILGFTPFAVFQAYELMPPMLRNNLLDQFKLFEEHIAEREKAQEEEAEREKAQEEESSKKAEGDLKVQK